MSYRLYAVLIKFLYVWKYANIQIRSFLYTDARPHCQNLPVWVLRVLHDGLLINAGVLGNKATSSFAWPCSDCTRYVGILASGCTIRRDFKGSLFYLKGYSLSSLDVVYRIKSPPLCIGRLKPGFL